MEGVAEGSVARPAEAAAISSCVLRLVAAHPHLIVYRGPDDSHESPVLALLRMIECATPASRHA